MSKFDRFGMTVAVFAGISMIGCAQMGAACRLGAENQRFEGRALEVGSLDYEEYLSLQKKAVPRWAKVLDERGNPDYIIPGFGSFCSMVWIDDQVYAENDTLGFVKCNQGLSDEIVEIVTRRRSKDALKMKKATREFEDAIREDAQRFYIESLKGEKAGACRFEIESMNYNDTTRVGVVVVNVPDQNFTAARIWTRQYVEMVAKDKNIALGTGSMHGESMYLLKDEKIENGKYVVVFEALY